MFQNKSIQLLNKTAWEKVVEPFSKYRNNMEVTSLFKYFSDTLNGRSKVLDMGCGTGIPFGKFIADKGHILTGIDFSEGMIEKAKKNVPKGNFRVELMENISKNEYYDGIVAAYSLQLLDHNIFTRVINLCSKVLKKNGIIYISLNEAMLNHNNYKVFMGERMFFKDYSVNDLVNIFSKYSLIKTKLQRSVEVSETFGTEHMLEIIFQKKADLK